MRSEGTDVTVLAITTHNLCYTSSPLSAACFCRRGPIFMPPVLRATIEAFDTQASLSHEFSAQIYQASEVT
jgi:hypothetical protein